VLFLALNSFLDKVNLMGYLLGYDIGSSSIKATFLEIETGRVLASVSSSESELEIIACHPGWAEQHPQIWWEHVLNRKLKDQENNANKTLHYLNYCGCFMFTGFFS